MHPEGPLLRVNAPVDEGLGCPVSLTAHFFCETIANTHSRLRLAAWTCTALTPITVAVRASLTLVRQQTTWETGSSFFGVEQRALLRQGALR